MAKKIFQAAFLPLLTTLLFSAILFIENLFGITAFPSDVYYLDKLPSEIQYLDSFLIVVFSIAICFLASLYPAWRASIMEPVDGLRYE